MERLRTWMAPIALCIAWMIAAAFVLVRLAQASDRPVATIAGPEVVIVVGEKPAALARR